MQEKESLLVGYVIRNYKNDFGWSIVCLYSDILHIILFRFNRRKLIYNILQNVCRLYQDSAHIQCKILQDFVVRIYF